MSSANKTMKGKCQITDDEATDFMDQSQYKKDSPKEKKAQKRLPNDQFEEEDISRLIGRYKATAIKKKKKNDIEELSTNESRVKILEFVGHQLEERKQCSEQLLKALTEIIAESEAEYKVMKENEEKIEHLSVTAMKCIEQSTAVRKQKLRAMKELHASYKNRCEELQNGHKAGTEKFVNELESDINKMQQKLVSESKRSSMEYLRRNILQTIQNDY